MAFNFRGFLKKLTETTLFDKAVERGFQEVGKAIDKNAHNPEAVKEIAKTLIKGAPEIRDAIKAGTEVEGQ